MIVLKLPATMPARVLIPLLTGIGGALVLVVFTLYQSRDSRAEIEDEARHDVRLMMTSVQASASYYLRQNDLAALQAVLESQEVQEQVKFLAVVDPAGTILAGTPRFSKGGSLLSVRPDAADILALCSRSPLAGAIRLDTRDNLLFGCYPANPSYAAGSFDSRNGYLIVSYDFSHRKLLGEQRLIRLTLLVWSLFGAGFLLLMALLRHALARRRIAFLLSATEKIAAGDLSARARVHGSDELGTVSQAFDRMADQLQAATQALERSRAELEQRVEQRTAELAKANKALEREIFVRTQAEETARRDGAWLRSLIETSQDAVVSIDRRAQVVLFNHSAERIFGYKAEEIAGRKVNLLMAEPHASEHDRYIADYERTGKACAVGQTLLLVAKRKNGELFPIELSLTEIPTEKNVRFAAFIRDVSEKAKMQAQLVESERLAAIGTTAAKIGHEIANPLNGMFLTIQLLEQRLTKEPPVANGQILSSVKKIREEIARLNQLVQDFRAMARQEKYEFQTLQIADLIDDVIAIQGPVCASLGIEIEQQLEPDLPHVSADRYKLKQAILNLLKNSIEAMPGGGRITIKGAAKKDSVIVSIIDTGAGTPADIDVFQPFVTSKSRGTGIGLFVVRQIVTAHHGTISYSSEAGRGTVFEISLPRKSPY